MGIQLNVRSQSNLPTWTWSGLNQANWSVSSLMLPMTGATTCRLSSAILPSRGSSQPVEFMENKIKFFSQKKEKKEKKLYWFLLHECSKCTIVQQWSGVTHCDFPLHSNESFITLTQCEQFFCPSWNVLHM